MNSTTKVVNVDDNMLINSENGVFTCVMTQKEIAERTSVYISGTGKGVFVSVYLPREFVEHIAKEFLGMKLPAVKKNKQ